jgi:hypothetical protein
LTAMGLPNSNCSKHQTRRERSRGGRSPRQVRGRTRRPGSRGARRRAEAGRQELRILAMAARSACASGGRHRPEAFWRFTGAGRAAGSTGPAGRARC